MVCLAFQGCKITAPPGTQVAEPVRITHMKGPIAISAGKLFFLEDKAVYKPNASSFVRKVEEIPYTEIDMAAKRWAYGIYPVSAVIKLKNGKKFRLISYKRKYVVNTLNSLKQ